MHLSANNSGQSLIEIIIAMAIFSLISVSLVSMILGGLALLSEGSSLTKASALAEEGMEAVRSIKNRAWNGLVYTRSAVTASESAWDFVGEGTSEQIDEFTRIIDFYPVYRNSSQDIVESSDIDANLDLNSKIVEIQMAWPNNRGTNNSKAWQTLLTNWDSTDWVQSDWSGGAGQSTWIDEARYDNDDGNVESGTPGQLTLSEISTSTYATSGSLESSAFPANGARAFISLSWVEDLPGGCPSCDVELQIKTAPDNSGSPGTWSSTWCGPDGDDGDEDDYFSVSDGELISTDHNGDEWIKYKIILSGEADNTPGVEEVKVNYQL